MEQIERVLDQTVRPQLQLHGGDVQVESLREGVLRVRLMGRCSGCPSANITTNELIEAAITQEIPQISRVVLISGVSSELMEQARAIMKARSR